jgi:hypothetical protein
MRNCFVIVYALFAVAAVVQGQGNPSFESDDIRCSACHLTVSWFQEEYAQYAYKIQTKKWKKQRRVEAGLDAASKTCGHVPENVALKGDKDAGRKFVDMDKIRKNTVPLDDSAIAELMDTDNVDFRPLELKIQLKEACEFIIDRFGDELASQQAKYRRLYNYKPQIDICEAQLGWCELPDVDDEEL